MFGRLLHLLAVILVLILGYIVARLIASLVRKALLRSGFDRTCISGHGGDYVQRVTKSPSRVVGTIVSLGAAARFDLAAALVLGIAALTAFVGAILAYVPNVIAAILIFLVAGAVATAVAALAQRTMGDTLDREDRRNCRADSHHGDRGSS